MQIMSIRATAEVSQGLASVARPPREERLSLRSPDLTPNLQHPPRHQSIEIEDSALTAL
eukprot:CAMPEP_0182524442 /NCGR_PEP_ID=MMETSP1323-20130603/1788_1 /TAXON_ID=236787 /ORGANISM="Florenciella parvula, Strain RCC1693" /LENGTH=58 /DNA_ID=CAMNT_0024733005 /DNA_START=1 /DNA_END=174 /DNA_ORIENTATION=+